MSNHEVSRYQINKHPYSLWLEAIPTTDGMTSFKFQTTWMFSKSPDELHNQMQVILSQDEIRRMIEVMSKYLKEDNGS